MLMKRVKNLGMGGAVLRKKVFSSVSSIQFLFQLAKISEILLVQSCRNGEKLRTFIFYFVCCLQTYPIYGGLETPRGSPPLEKRQKRPKVHLKRVNL